jgi:hypothetical protein
MRFNNSEVAVAAGVAVGALAVYELTNRSSLFRRWLEDWLNPMVSFIPFSYSFQG